MSSAISQTGLTPDDLLAMPDEKDYELVDGQLVERKIGSESSWVAGELHAILRNFVKQQNLGWVWPPDEGFQCFPHDPNKVRRPDVSFIQRGRLPDGRPARGYERVSPDLAVEVTSPHDLFRDVNEKVEEFLAAGVRLIWVIDPDSRLATIHRADGSTDRIHENDHLDGEDVLPGFSCRLGDLFLPAEESAN